MSWLSNDKKNPRSTDGFNLQCKSVRFDECCFRHKWHNSIKEKTEEEGRKPECGEDNEDLFCIFFHVFESRYEDSVIRGARLIEHVLLCRLIVCKSYAKVRFAF